MVKPLTVKKPASAKLAKPAQPDEGFDAFEDPTDDAGGDFFEKQKALIDMVMGYLMANPSGNKRMTLKDFCEVSGLSVATVTAIVNGNRWVAKCSRDTVEKLARVLNISVIQVYFLSGFFAAQDAVFTVGIKETLDLVYLQMTKDRRMGIRCPSQGVWDSWPLSAQLHFVMMYEQLTDQIFLRYAEG